MRIFLRSPSLEVGRQPQTNQHHKYRRHDYSGASTTTPNAIATFSPSLIYVWPWSP